MFAVPLLAASLALTACAEGQGFSFKNLKRDGAGASADGDVVTANRSIKLIERDVEVPDVFQATEAGLWDGRPSLGGVWVAHPDVAEPERVIIRNSKNSKFVIGALFRREREAPGPRLQVSSDAAAALGMLAGQPMNLNVTALRREEVADDVAPAPDTTAASLTKPAEIATGTLDPVADVAARALDETPVIEAAASADAVAPAAPVTSALSKPYVQVGIFSIEKNARNTASTLSGLGIVPTVKKQSAKGKTFWRVVAGPATTQSELADILKKVKAKGFTDAYAVSN
ncbi:sporulation domain-containing protein [Pseudaestuariivita atlantica]|uniref:Sporulation domain-containing protein n=2 Tax=Pseudaestuariivita atlantica TaxID=1317121 RepID=A0A0L1JTN2_9RHOB|nr:sporulation domain-containing protein [Pseudaestuariivita atlantica]